MRFISGIILFVAALNGYATSLSLPEILPANGIWEHKDIGAHTLLIDSIVTSAGKYYIGPNLAAERQDRLALNTYLSQQRLECPEEFYSVLGETLGKHNWNVVRTKRIKKLESVNSLNERKVRQEVIKLLSSAEELGVQRILRIELVRAGMVAEYNIFGLKNMPRTIVEREVRLVDVGQSSLLWNKRYGNQRVLGTYPDISNKFITLGESLKKISEKNCQRIGIDLLKSIKRMADE